MSLLEDWRSVAYNSNQTRDSYDRFWNTYFAIEKGIYEKILVEKEPISGTVAQLAEKFDVKVLTMVGFLDGIDESLKKPNDIENMTEESVVSLDFDKEKLYYNMVGAKASWLYELPQWDELLTEERRKELYKESKSSTTIVKDKKIGRNDPCPCGSGKKYKFCCGK